MHCPCEIYIIRQVERNNPIVITNLGRKRSIKKHLPPELAVNYCQICRGSWRASGRRTDLVELRLADGRWHYFDDSLFDW